MKFVRKIITNNEMSLYFKTGDAEIKIGKGDADLKIMKSSIYIRGCIALIKF